ncbi:adaptive-response sensory-kinase SasA [Rhodoferax lithotrophicus]|uniref:histidine kinase n=1 Tax=Rhodoferax lithotrophicus TaxID=2798804 RepID=A0ABM7MGG2_9BURK|nr:GAF domain-containing protein [Rhodoferax sp. MIZ03]BCO25284.1 adaptive-response sensory-kinase SasA [Rhodoferax sp. MIZ03]
MNRPSTPEDFPQRMVRLYAMALECHSAIIHSTGQTSLFESVCQFGIQSGVFDTLWISLMDTSTRGFKLQAHAGQPMEDVVHAPMDQVFRSVSENRPLWCNDLLNDAAATSLTSLARQYNWKSAAVIPLTTSHGPVAAMFLFAKTGQTFDKTARRLLTQLADNISRTMEAFAHVSRHQQIEFALQESEVRYNALFASSSMPMLVVDPHPMRVVDANIKAVNFFQLDHVPLTAGSGLNRASLQANPALVDVLDRLENQADQPAQFTVKYPVSDTQTLDLEVFCSPISIGGKLHFLLAFNDITARCRIEVSLQAAHQLTQSFIDQIPGTVFLKDKQLRVVMANKFLGQVLGVDPQTLIGKTAHEIFPPDLADALTIHDHALLQSGRSQTMEQVLGEQHFETSLFVVNDAAGEPCLGGISMDVTARQQASETTRAMLRLHEVSGQLSEHEFLSMGLEMAETLTHSQIGFLHFVNEDQESLELVAWTRGALQGCSATHDTHYPISQAGIWVDCLRDRQPFVCNDYTNYPAKRGLPPGHAELRRLLSVPVFEQGRVCLILGVGNKTGAYEAADVERVQLIGNDLWRITRKARVEKALQEKVTELESTNRQLLNSQLQLVQSEKLAAVGQLAAGVAHEINNPIAFVNTNLGTLKIYMQSLLTLLGVYERCASANSATDGVILKQARIQADLDFLREDVPSLLSESSDGLERVKKIVLDLRDFARVDNEGWVESDLLAGLESTLNVARNELKYTVDIVKDLTPLPLVRCHLAQINQVFLNMLLNAAQAMKGHGQIILRSGIEGGWVWVSLQDTGIGMTAEVKSRIFEPFFTTKPVGKGTGLGLSLSFDIVKKHGGRIEVNSTPGQGSCFQVWLPVAGPASDRV